MKYRVVPGSKEGEYLVISGEVLIERLTDKQDATELAEYLNGGEVPSYMMTKE
jgi:hypothetical protein